MSPTSRSSPAGRSGGAGPRAWIEGARPRTLGASVSPVVVGTAAAAAVGDVVLWRFVAALVVAVGLQVGVNYANDYSDGVRGTDDDRVGPRRLTASGLVPPERVRLAAILALAAAAVAGLAVSVAVDPRLILVGAASIVAAWLYTGGRRPYGYRGLGELSVFLFFGLVATCGSAYVQLERVPLLALAASVPVGLFAVAILLANNIRDAATDAKAGKRTLVVRVGVDTGRRLYWLTLALAVAVIVALGTVRPLALLALVPVLLFALRPPVRAFRARTDSGGPALIQVLVATARLQLLCSLLLAIGLWSPFA